MRLVSRHVLIVVCLRSTSKARSMDSGNDFIHRDTTESNTRVIIVIDVATALFSLSAFIRADNESSTTRKQSIDMCIDPFGVGV